MLEVIFNKMRHETVFQLSEHMPVRWINGDSKLPVCAFVYVSPVMNWRLGWQGEPVSHQMSAGMLGEGQLSVIKQFFVLFFWVPISSENQHYTRASKFTTSNLFSYNKIYLSGTVSEVTESFVAGRWRRGETHFETLTRVANRIRWQWTVERPGLLSSRRWAAQWWEVPPTHIQDIQGRREIKGERKIIGSNKVMA